jgi:1-acyl-sn-glycerol-3-phosphate acyltransferase
MGALTALAVNTLLRGFTGMVCKIDDAELVRIPKKGPLILVGNHVNFLDAPILMSRLPPRRVTALAKVETWDDPLVGFLFTMWNGIPIRRGEVDLEAFRQARLSLDRGEILVVCPEGTRSNDGKLQKGLPGVVLLAERSGVPLLPIAYYGIEHFHRNIRSLTRTPCRLMVGSPFKVDTHGEKLSSELSATITDQIMYQMAALLPPAYRGVYSNMSKARENYLHFEEGVPSNFKRTHFQP